MLSYSLRAEVTCRLDLAHRCVQRHSGLINFFFIEVAVSSKGLEVTHKKISFLAFPGKSTSLRGLHGSHPPEDKERVCGYLAQEVTTPTPPRVRPVPFLQGLAPGAVHWVSCWMGLDYFRATDEILILSPHSLLSCCVLPQGRPGISDSQRWAKHRTMKEQALEKLTPLGFTVSWSLASRLPNGRDVGLRQVLVP